MQVVPRQAVVRQHNVRAFELSHLAYIERRKPLKNGEPPFPH
jgi:hypothetical protein